MEWYWFLKIDKKCIIFIFKIIIQTLETYLFTTVKTIPIIQCKIKIQNLKVQNSKILNSKISKSKI
jgi:hypothetical protein